MSRTLGTFETSVPVGDIPRSMVVYTYDGHLLEMDLNRWNGRVFVRYPKAPDSLALVSRVFGVLDSCGFLDDLILRPSMLSEDSGSAIVLARDPDELDETRRYVAEELEGVCL